MLIYLLICALLSIAFVLVARQRELLQLSALLFFVAQISVAVYAVINSGQTHFMFFTFDPLGTTYFCLMAVMGILTAWRSFYYFDTESIRHCKIYFVALIMLNLALAGVYLSNNIAMGWIFLEATTIAAAALTYHRRTTRSLEATWKYIFVSSVGIAIAYLGILLLSTCIEEGGSLSYSALVQAAAAGNPLYLKLAFIFILVGYSTKMEIFPLFTVGVDANHSAPTPASAFISSAMVGGGFVSLFRVYNIMGGNTEVILWVEKVLLIVGVISLIVAAVYMGRTGNYKRFFAYSTVENSGLVAIGLGLGGIGVWAAVLHSLAHTIIKGVAYLQLSVVGKMYGNYKVGRIGNYIATDKVGALVMILTLVALLAFPPSVLFRTEILMLSTMMDGAWWWMIIPVGFSLLAVIYWLSSKMLSIVFKPTDISKVDLNARSTIFSSFLLVLLIATFVCGIWLAPELSDLITTICDAK